jgi:hypothetical protein
MQSHAIKEISKQHHIPLNTILYHISGFRIKFLNYLRGLNDPIMIQTKSKPLQHHFCKSNQGRQLSIHTLEYNK